MSLGRAHRDGAALTLIRKRGRVEGPYRSTTVTERSTPGALSQAGLNPENVMICFEKTSGARQTPRSPRR